MRPTVDWRLRLDWRFFFERQEAHVNNPAIVALTLARAEEEAYRRGWWRSWKEEVDEDTGCATEFDEVFLLEGEEGEEGFRVLASMGGVRRTTADIREAAAWLAIEALLLEKMQEVRAA